MRPRGTDVRDAIEARALRAFLGELAALAYGFGEECDVGWLRRELALEFGRLAARELRPRPRRDRGAP